MSRDMLTIGSTTRILLLCRGEYSQWSERFMNYHEEQTDEEAMINSIKNGDQPLPRVTQKKIQKIDRLERSLLIQGLPNDIYSLIDSNKTAKDLWDALVRHMLGSEYGEQDRKATVLKEKVVVSSESEGSDDELKKITALLAKAFDRKKFYSKPTNNNLRTSSATSSANKKQEYVKSDDKKEEKRVDEKKRDMSKVKCYNCKKEGQFAKHCKKAKVKNYEYYKTKMLLANKDKDEQVLLAENHAWMESSSDSDQEINENMVFMAQIEKVLLDSEASSSSSDDKIAKIVDQEILFDNMSRQLVEFDENVRMLKNTVLEKDLKIPELEECVHNKDLEITKCLERLNECENKLHKTGQTNQTIHMIMPYKDKMYNGRKGSGFENLSYFYKAKDLRPTLYDERVIGLGYTSMFLNHSNEALEVEKFKRARENKLEFAYDYGSLNASYVNEKINFLDDYFQEIINLNFEKINSPFQQTSSLKPYVSTMILEKIIIDLEDEVVSLLEKEKEHLKIIESLKSKGFESSENAISESKNQSKNDCQVIEKGCDQVENSNVIAPEMFKLSVSQSVSPISVTKTSCASNSVEIKLKRKRCKRTSSKHHDKQVNKDVLRANKTFVYFLDLDTLSSVRRPKPSGVIAFDCNNARNALRNARMNASVDVNDLFVFVDVSIRKSHVSKMPFRKKPSASLNVPSRSKLNKSLPRIVRCSKHMTGNRALLTNFVEKFLGTVRFGNHDFAVIVGCGDVVIGSTTIKKVYYVEDGVNLLTGDRSSNLYTISLNEVASNSSACLLAKASSSQSWLWHQRLSRLNFATINNLVKNNLVRGLPKMKFEKDHLCFTCEQVKIHRKHHNSKMAFASNKPLYLLHMDLCGPMRVESINEKLYVLVVVDDYLLYTWVFFLHSKDEASEVIISFIKKTQVNLQLQNAITKWCRGKEKSNLSQSCKNYAYIYVIFSMTMMTLESSRQKGILECLLDILKKSAAFRIYNKRTRKIHKSVNVNFDEISEMAFKSFSLEPGLSNLNETRKSLNPTVLQVSEALKKDLEDLFEIFYDEYFDSSKIMKSSTMNVETFNVEIPSQQEEVFHESSESFQEESSSSSLNDDVQQSPKEVILPQTNTQSISNDMIPSVDEASTSHNVFNERLEDAFDASTSFHDPSNVHIFYQPYPHEKNWTKDHPLHKIIGDPKSNVRTRGQLANLCLVSCLLSSIKPANVAEALRDADWVSTMQDELDQFVRLKV
uniref:Uncharacterized protein n=1 Tax=Tanacetum cinerariifolium TaxID=118510 RepID=A0A6L2P6Y0_TANCI|nr:hypothetical protein [Tanacetum cinerariifolium]